jgi:DNA end-binding protein Ku
MYSAIETKDLHFDLVHQPDGGPIGYQKYCKLEDEPVPNEEIVKAYEVERGEYVYLTEEDFAAAEAEGGRTIDVEDFVPYEEIDPIYFERTYHLGPEEGSERVYALFLRALERSGLAGVVRFVMRDREHLGCLRVREGVLTLERMYFADEVRPVEGIALGKVKVDERELELAEQLIDRFSGSWEPERYHDTYRERLLAIVEAKQKGEEVHAERVPEPEEPADLLEALRASVDAAKQRRRPAKKRSRSRKTAATRRGAASRKPART